MSYNAPKETHEIFVVAAQLETASQYAASFEVAPVKRLAALARDLADRYSALHGPDEAPAVTLRMNQYQADNLFKFLMAVERYPDSQMASWSTGDWWGELVYMLREQGANAEKGNPH